MKITESIPALATLVESQLQELIDIGNDAQDELDNRKKDREVTCFGPALTTQKTLMG